MTSVRFAPSPSGAFHLGNFRTAWVANEIAHRTGRELVIRFEDIDEPRVVVGAEARQLLEMTALGVQTEKHYRQSTRHARHFALFRRAIDEGRVYACHCSRKEVQQALTGLASAPHASTPHTSTPIYNGNCRPAEPGALRRDDTAKFDGAWGWRYRGDRADGSQDFLVARTNDQAGAGFTPAYHWACAIDDYDGEYALLVRAWDLAGAAEQQRAIHRMMASWEGERPVPAIFHTALVTSDDGHRLEKRTPGVTWPEMLAHLGDAAAIREFFTQSFLADWSKLESWVVAGALNGESRPTLTLRELGF